MQFGVLGPLQVVAGDYGEPGVVSAARLRALLAVLLWRANQPVPADELAELVWDGSPPRGTSEAVRALVMRLRRRLGERAAARVVTSAPGYAIEVSADELDASRFETLFREADTAVRAGHWAQAARSAAEALGLWRGPALMDIPSQLLRDRWVPHLEQLHVQALEWRIEADLHEGRHERLIPELRDLTARHPLREHFHGQLMLALARSGRQAEALAAYQEARRVLASELGIDPGAELIRLHERVLAQDAGLKTLATATAEAARPLAPAEPAAGDAAGDAPAVSTPPRRRPRVPPRQLPALTSSFAGRPAQLRTLSAWLGDAGRPAVAGPVIVIAGAAGVGKTTLALHWGHQAADRFPDGQLWLNLRGFDPAAAPLSPPEAIRTLLDALNVPPGQLPFTLDAQAGLYRSLLAGKRFLVMLDNARDTSQVRPLLPGSPGCLVVITSRSRLAGLAAIEGAQVMKLDVLPGGEARQLLAGRLGRQRLALGWEAADELIRLCAGLPLALAVAAARATLSPNLRLADLAAELRDAHTRLDVLDGGDLPSSLRAVFASSYRQLRPDAARMFRLLGLHGGPSISIAAAGSLAAVPERQARQLLSRLTDEHMLTEEKPGRYAFHDLLRVYARDLAQQDESPASGRAALHRALDHYVHTACAAMLRMNALPHPFTLAPASPGVTPEEITSAGQARAWFGAEQQVLHEAVAQAADAGFPGHAWRIAVALGSFLNRISHAQESIGVLSIALGAVEDPDDLGLAHLHLKIGRAYIGIRSFADADTHLREALRRFTVVNDLIGQATAYQFLNIMCDLQGSRREALRHARMALDVFRQAGNERGTAGTLNSVGWMLIHLGDYEQGLNTCREALELSTRMGFLSITAETWDSIGCANHHLGRHGEALTCYRRALHLHRQVGNSYYLADTFVHIGDTCYAAGDLMSAREAWGTALAILIDLDHPDAEAVEHKLRLDVAARPEPEAHEGSPVPLEH